jgi:sporulation protein ytfJ
MADHVEKVLDNAIEGIKKLVDVNGIIGEPIKVSDKMTVIPVSKVSLGFASGGSSFGKDIAKDNFGGGAGGGAKISPVAFLVISDDNVRLLSVSGSPDKYDKVINLVPDMVDKILNLLQKNKDDETNDDN